MKIPRNSVHIRFVERFFIVRPNIGGQSKKNNNNDLANTTRTWTVRLLICILHGDIVNIGYCS